MTEKSRPIQKLKSGPVTAAIWRQEGKHGPFCTVTIMRHYQNINEQGEKEWKETASLGVADLPHVSWLAAQAQMIIANLDDESEADEAA